MAISVRVVLRSFAGSRYSSSCRNYARRHQSRGSIPKCATYVFGERFDKSDDQILYMVSIEVLTDVWLYNFSIAILGTVRKTVGQVVFQALDAIGECCVFADDRCRVKLEAEEGIIKVLLPSDSSISTLNILRSQAIRETYASWWLIAATHWSA